MKTLVTFYSLGGNTRLIAETIAKETGADILELRPEKEIPSKGFKKYLLGGRAVMTKEMPALKSFDKDPQGYDVVFIGTPVWAGSYSSPLNTFFGKTPLSGKKVALFCCHRGGRGWVFQNMRKALKDQHILGEIDFIDPLTRNSAANIEKAKKWARDILAAL